MLRFNTKEQYANCSFFLKSSWGIAHNLVLYVKVKEVGPLLLRQVFPFGFHRVWGLGLYEGTQRKWIGMKG